MPIGTPGTPSISPSMTISLTHNDSEKIVHLNVDAMDAFMDSGTGQGQIDAAAIYQALIDALDASTEFTLQNPGVEYIARATITPTP